MITLGVQYYRPPFPDTTYWADDFARIRDSGLNTIQLWVLWSWVEATPGKFVFDDYDRLMELADKNGLGVVLSAIAEVQPYWIHREVPGSEMITSMGHKVVSSNRGEIHFGITPGGCFDHPGVWERMTRFFQAVTRQYHNAAALRGWDAWNELRWNINADGLVCYCPHTLREYRDWLERRFGGLDGLNRAWKRRYSAWDEVLPGKAPARPFTEMMSFQHFLTVRNLAHAKKRYEVMRQLDPHRPITVHGDNPSVLKPGGADHTALDRGNDWLYADALDGIGCSSFPLWARMDDVNFACRIDYTRSAAGGKRVWLSEVQGGSAASGLTVHPTVDAPSQQRWLWTGLACGAETILFWCWRDEVFTTEAGGFGIIGSDGQAEQRLAALRRTGKVVREHQVELEAYRPARGQVGVLHSPQSYYYYWSVEGHANRAQMSMEGYAYALQKLHIPFEVVEEEHLDALEGLKVLFLPRAVVIDEAVAARLEMFVRDGGTLVAESECGAFDSVGLYRYAADRFLVKLTGCAEAGRRELGGNFIDVNMDGQRFHLPATQWLTPLMANEGALAVRTAVGKGSVVQLASYVGDPYLASALYEEPKWREGLGDFEAFIGHLCAAAGCKPVAEVVDPAGSGFTYIKVGHSDGKTMAFVIPPRGVEELTLRLAPGLFPGRKAKEIVSGQMVEFSPSAEGMVCKVRPDSEIRVAVLLEIK